jgi:hypothetical protein
MIRSFFMLRGALPDVKDRGYGPSQSLQVFCKIIISHLYFVVLIQYRGLESIHCALTEQGVEYGRK